ncbi:hypothetical protein HY635_02305 [Candidatus Uhrbacteria bacterium]|nr:hypothetical protein [Candidatus Uhrbacteria bacterium]
MPEDLIEPVVEIVSEVASAGLDAAASSRSGRGFGTILLVTLAIVAIVIGIAVAVSDDEPAAKPPAAQER